MADGGVYDLTKVDFDFNNDTDTDNKKTNDEATKEAINQKQEVKTTAMGKSNVIDKVINSKKNVNKNSNVFKGIYFEPDIYEVITQIINDSGKKNIQSSIVNDCLREVFRDRGLL